MNVDTSSIYYEQFREKTFVIEAEGDGVELKGSLAAILQGIKDLIEHDIKVILVYGKGKGFEKRLSKQFGAYRHLETSKIVVPDSASTCIQSERIRIGTDISKLCRSLSIPHVLLSQSLVSAERRIGHQATGSPLSIDKREMRSILKDGQVPIIGFGGEDDRHSFLHVPSVNIASDIAAGLRAQKLMLLTHGGGIFVRNTKGEQCQLSFADVEELLCLLQRKDEQGRDMLSGDIVTKVHASIKAASGGVKQVHIVSERKLLEEILTRTGVGTMVEQHQSHHVDYAYPRDLNDIVALHNEALSYTTKRGTSLVKPRSRKNLKAALPYILALKHSGVLVGKLHGTPIEDVPNATYIGGFVIAEDHQNSQQGQVLLSEALTRFKNQGDQFSYAITAADGAKKLFARHEGKIANLDAPWKEKLLAESRERYKEDEKDLVELFEFNLKDV